MEYKTIQTPWLIQRGKFKDISEDQIVGIDSLIQFDYMGSSEFEWGALPKALKVMTSNWKDYICFQIDSIKDNDGEYLQVLCNKIQAVEVRELIIALFNDKDHKIRLKERTGMQDYLACESRYALDINFWWDITGSDYMNPCTSNGWMCCFGISNVRKIIIAMRKVWIKHNSPDVDVNKNTNIINVSTSTGTVTVTNVKAPVAPVKPAIPVLPELGPDLPALSGKPRLTQVVIEEDRTRIEVTALNGRKTIINKRSILEVIARQEEIEVTVLNKAGIKRGLYLIMELSNQRKLLENMLNEQLKFNEFHNTQKEIMCPLK